MMTLALAVLLSAAPVAEGAFSFDAQPSPPSMNNDRRVQRFLGALAGGAVGLGGTLAFTPLAGEGCTPSFGVVSCFSFGQGLLVTLAPLVSVTGAWLGWLLAGGEGNPLVASAAIPAAALVTMALMALSGVMQSRTGLDFMPFIIAGSAVLVGGAALALDLRQNQLASLGGASEWGSAAAGRFTVESLVSLLTLGASTGLVLLLNFILPWYAFGGGPALLAAAMALSAGGLSLAAAATVFGVHRAMGGKGTFRAALLGTGLTVTAVGAGLALLLPNLFSGGSFTLQAQTSISSASFFLMATVAALFVPAMALEWSHAENTRSKLPALSFGAAPLPEGGMVSAGLRF